MSSNYRNLVLCAAACSLLGAITTSLLVFLPASSTVDTQNTILLYKDNLYTAKLWILFFHPQFNFIAALGIAALLVKKYPLEIVTGTFFMLVWAVTEMSQQAFLIDALNQYWRPAYMAAQDEMSRDIFLALIKGSDAISDSKYFVLLYGFAMGSLLYGIAMTREKGISRWLGIAYLFIGALSLGAFTSYYLGAAFLSAPVAWCYEWIYPYLQPLVRIAVAAWLFMYWKESRELAGPQD